jgi:hypothetical protein
MPTQAVIDDGYLTLDLTPLHVAGGDSKPVTNQKYWISVTTCQVVN